MCTGLLPDLLWHDRPVFSRKTALDPRRDIGPDQRRFYGQSTRTAERIQKDTFGVPVTQLDHGRGQCLPQRSAGGQRAIPASVQPGTARVYGQGGFIF